MGNSQLAIPTLRFSISLKSDWYGTRAMKWVADVVPDSDIAFCSPNFFIVDTLLRNDLPQYAERLNSFQPFSPIPQTQVFNFMLKNVDGYDGYERFQLPIW